MIEDYYPVSDELLQKDLILSNDIDKYYNKIKS